jgi:hypothetical protein
MAKHRETFVCPCCGGEVRKGAKACPHCGADERTGWSEQTYLDGLDIGGDEDYEELVLREFGGKGRRGRRQSWYYVAVALTVLALFIYAYLLRWF